MKINKNLGEELYRLFGPNGSDSICHVNERLRMKALKELARHGLVELTHRTGEMAGLVDAKRTCRGLSAPESAAPVVG